ncbi:MAG: MBL fold metallo-hydrolase [Chloroflexi bacterium]|nr:MBL fold metallo-hydrolase [Chloroflexota bacterium]
MLLKQYYLNCLAQASYLIADDDTKTAVIVDPRRDIDIYLDDARQLGLTITHAILTHFHADFVAGHIELRDRVGARIALGANAGADYDFQPLADGENLVLGPGVHLQALATPGHTPEAISLLVYDDESDPSQPHAVLTGDTLFIGDVGRPDLMASVGVTAEELASSLYDSLQLKLLPLPDKVIVYPGHGAGSLCGRALSSATQSTMGEQRLYNYALEPMDKAAFIALVTTDLPAVPDYFSYDADLNRRERPTIEGALGGSAQPLSLDRLLHAQSSGAQILDVRDSGSFAAAHLAGSINVGLEGQFASWAGTLLDRETPIVIVAEPGEPEEAALRLGRIGFDNVSGFLDGGMAALADRDDLLARFDRYAPGTLRERLAEKEAACIVDVRAQAELQEGKLDDSLHIPLPVLTNRLSEIPFDCEVILYCAGGYRSPMAASLLLRNGYKRVADLAGGYGAWAATA